VIIITHERDIAGMTDRIVHMVDGMLDWDRPNRRRDPTPAEAPVVMAAEG
jgi:ABC-type lipoprotein export system ATPase subunit